MSPRLHHIRAAVVALVVLSVAAGPALVLASALSQHPELPLGGLSRAQSAPPPPTAEQLDSLMTEYNTRVAESTQGPGAAPVDFVRFVADADWAGVMQHCVGARGMGGIQFGPDQSISWVGGVEAEDPAITSLRDDAVRTCFLQYPTETLRAELRTHQQLDYLYNYFSTVLAPCLRLAGYTAIPVPGRDLFHAAAQVLYLWSPYDDYALTAVTDSGGLRLDVIAGRSAAAVPGMPDVPAIPRHLLENQCPPLPPGAQS